MQIYQEKVSDVGLTRSEFQKMMQQIRQNDVLIIWRLDRFARSTRMLLKTIEILQERGASFKSLQEPWADTTSAAGQMVMTFFAGPTQGFSGACCHQQCSPPVIRLPGSNQ